MDTRSKILTLAAALELRPAVTVAAGTFDVLRAEHARELAAVRKRTGMPLLVVVLPLENEVLPQPARAEVVAALRMVDFVVIADSAELDRLIGVLRPAEVVRMEAADAHRTKQLIEHVLRRQAR